MHFKCVKAVYMNRKSKTKRGDLRKCLGVCRRSPPNTWSVFDTEDMTHMYIWVIFTYLHISFKTAGLSRVPVRISVKQTVQHSLFCLCCRRRESDRRLHLSEGCQCPQCTKHTPRNTRAQSTAFIWCTLCVLVDFYFYLSFF